MIFNFLLLGYHELAYLHPNHFTADAKIVEAYGIDTSKPYFVMRFASLNAHHDSGIKGINTEIAQRLIDILEGSACSLSTDSGNKLVPQTTTDPSRLVPLSTNSSSNNSTKGTSLTPSEACSLYPSACSLSADSGNKPRIYITSERPLEPQFEKYRINFGVPKETNECVSNGESGGPEYSLSKRGFDTRTSVPNATDMHHVMAFASLYIGDSQTMAAEAGVLGVPFVRFNDFVGRIGYLREQEDTYHLGFGIKASSPGSVDQLCSRVEELVSMDSAERRKIWAERRQTMLSDKIDCAKFLTWFIENYPQSATEVKNATPDFWDRFK